MKYQNLLSRIGACIDRLVEMGFVPISKSLISEYKYTNISYLNGLDINFEDEFACVYTPKLGNIGFYYTSDTWQQDLLKKVKELIRDGDNHYQQSILAHTLHEQNNGLI